MTPRTIAALGVLTAWVAALGFLLVSVPNVELMTLSAFLSGALVGTGGGAVVGFLAMAIFSGLNPYGIAPPPVYATQMLGLAAIGAAGGVVGTRVAPRGIVSVLVYGALGFSLTVFYDVLTNLATAVVIGATADPWPVVAAGLAFTVWHFVFNAIFFAVLAPPFLAWMRRRHARRLA
jgi:hypothetical protein